MTTTTYGPGVPPPPEDRIRALASELPGILDALLDNAEAFTCSEADTVARIYRLAGLPNAAARFLGSHQDADDCLHEHNVTEG